jgi:hypothetical protein
VTHIEQVVKKTKAAKSKIVEAKEDKGILVDKEKQTYEVKTWLGHAMSRKCNTW